MARARVGCSGWAYDHWRGVLYPEGLGRTRWRDVYAAQFDTVELNASFYRWPGVRPFRGWSQSLPEGFTMSFKASRWLTHGHRLRDPDGAWATRLTEASRALGDRAGAVLLQLPDDFERDDDRLDGLLARLPGDVRVAVEVRRPSWQVEEVFALLERRGAAYVVMSGAHLPCHLRATAPFVYVRLHGPSHDQLYAGSYSEDDLAWWAARIEEWRAQGRDVFAYFNNDGCGHAVRNARRLRELLPDRTPSLDT